MSELQEKTIVRAVVREQKGSSALVEVASGGCGRCHEKGGCGGQHLTQMFCSGPKTYLADNPLGAVVGESVEVAVESGAIRETANLAYGIPLLATLGGALAGSQWGGDAYAMLGALAGLSLAVLFVRYRIARAVGKFAARPHIISRS